MIEETISFINYFSKTEFISEKIQFTSLIQIIILVFNIVYTNHNFMDFLGICAMFIYNLIVRDK
jgi:hypothetical protein